MEFDFATTIDDAIDHPLIQPVRLAGSTQKMPHVLQTCELLKHIKLGRSFFVHFLSILLVRTYSDRESNAYPIIIVEAASHEKVGHFQVARGITIDTRISVGQKRSLLGIVSGQRVRKVSVYHFTAVFMLQAEFAAG